MVDGATVTVTELGDHGARIDLVSGGRIVRLVDVESDGATPAYLFSYSEAGVRGLAETLAVQVDAGGTQVFSSVMPLADTRRYRLALRYRTTGGLLFVRALRREDVTWGVLKGATGEPVSRLFELWSAKGAEPGWHRPMRWPCGVMSAPATPGITTTAFASCSGTPPFARETRWPPSGRPFRACP